MIVEGINIDHVVVGIPESFQPGFTAFALVKTFFSPPPVPGLAIFFDRIGDGLIVFLADRGVFAVFGGDQKSAGVGISDSGPVAVSLLEAFFFFVPVCPVVIGAPVDVIEEIFRV